MLSVEWIFYCLIATERFVPPDYLLLLLLLLSLGAVIASIWAWIDSVWGLFATLAAVLGLIGLLALAFAS